MNMKVPPLQISIPVRHEHHEQKSTPARREHHQHLSGQEAGPAESWNLGSVLMGGTSPAILRPESCNDSFGRDICLIQFPFFGES